MKSATPARLVEIDGLRGIAALGVAVFHLKILLQGDPNPLSAIWGADLILQKGWHLVDLFFVLSGFIFAHGYLRDGVMRAGVGLRSFAYARFSRLWPLHAAVLGFTGIMLFDDPDTTAFNFVMSLAMLHVFLPDIEVLNPPVWSISVEVICYVVFAALALQNDRRILLFGACALVLVGGFFVWFEFAPKIGRGLLGFFLGTLVYRFRDRLGDIPLALLCAAVALFGFLDGSYASLLIETLICWPAAILLAPRLTFLCWPAFQWLGSRSYAIYIVHVPIYIFVGNILMLLPYSSSELKILTGLGVALLISDILHRRLEIPAQTFLRRHAYLQPQPAAR